ncbi:biotin--[acetyl-CoA-carboxylase] ligase [Ensifer soli]|uniref:biotin--[acetyl-CoA-carboxylase] ligase n=1 Tax=Ciceribacter sp. sgz301302 TaxID=3342379 RepID=UPI0035BA3606
MTGSDGRRLRLFDAYRHEAIDEIDSTNSAALTRARAGEAGGLWITAGRQTGGRGRRGRAWVSERGNLYASLLLIDPAPVERLHSLPLAVAVALHRAVSAVLPAEGAPVRLKWPNDVLIGGAKTSGILLEGEKLVDGRYALVIGCGVNIAHAPDNGLYTVTSLGAEGGAVSPDELFAHLFVAMAEVLDLWDEGRGIGRVIAEWTAVAAGIGERITVNLPDRSLPGRFAGLDHEGRLILIPDEGAPIHIAAGDVFFG